MLQQLAEIDLGEPYASELVPAQVFQVLKLLLVELLGESLREYGHPVLPSGGEAFNYGAFEDCGDIPERYFAFAELLGNQCDSGPCCFTYSESEVPRLSPHRNYEEPPVRRLCVLHEVMDELGAYVPGCLEPECRYVARQRDVVVYRLRDVRHLYPAPAGFFYLACEEHRPVSAYRYEVSHAEHRETADRVLHPFRARRWGCPRYAHYLAGCVVYALPV